jgi:hypothetical protein
MTDIDAKNFYSEFHVGMTLVLQTVHITPRHTQHWQWSVCHTVAWRIVSWHTRKQCRVSVAGRWQLAARWCQLQIMCQPGTSEGIQKLDITETHTASLTCDFQWHYRSDVMDLPPSSPYLIPSNFCLLEPLKKHVAGKRFTADSEMKQCVTGYRRLTSIPSMPRYKALVPKWDKCLNVSGDYFVLWCVPPVTHVPFIHQSRNKFLGIIRVFFILVF